MQFYHSHQLTPTDLKEFSPFVFLLWSNEGPTSVELLGNEKHVEHDVNWMNEKWIHTGCFNCFLAQFVASVSEKFESYPCQAFTHFS